MRDAGPATLFAEAALVGAEICDGVAIDIDADGTIGAVRPGSAVPPNAERLAGLTVPGLANLHSHAFQRAMAGLAERGGPEGDDFWSWREVMYRFLAVLTPDDVEAIAAQLYAECLLQGYTSVAEFHYLHRAPDGGAYDDPAELSRRILAAAERSGIGLALLPVFYAHGGFGGAAPSPGQRRFVLGLDDFADLMQLLGGDARGVAPHSLRAATPTELAAVAAMTGGPVHIHAAEQVREVADCLAWSGARPVQWLLDNAGVDARWCLIHATHMTPDETARLAASGAVAGLCPTTEANLGDGLFSLQPFLAAGGRFGIGSDSNVGTSPVEELRWLEYVRRLEARARNVGETRPGASVGASLLARATAGGAQALGRAAGIAVGSPADLVVLDDAHPALVGRRGETLLDAWVFSGNATPVRHVMAGGRWVVRDGAHLRGPEIAAHFARTMRRLAAA